MIATTRGHDYASVTHTHSKWGSVRKGGQGDFEVRGVNFIGGLTLRTAHILEKLPILPNASPMIIY